MRWFVLKTDVLSKEYLQQALLILMENKHIEKINVSELCQKAGVSRMTFYRLYGDKMEVIKNMISNIGMDFTQQNNQLIDVDFKKYLIILFGILKKYSKVTTLLMKSDLQYLLQNYFTYVFILNNDKSPIYNNYYFSGALWNVYMCWLKNGMEESEEQLADIICHIINDTVAK